MNKQTVVETKKNFENAKYLNVIVYNLDPVFYAKI